VYIYILFVRPPLITTTTTMTCLWPGHERLQIAGHCWRQPIGTTGIFLIFNTHYCEQITSALGINGIINFAVRAFATSGQTFSWSPTAQIDDYKFHSCSLHSTPGGHIVNLETRTNVTDRIFPYANVEGHVNVPSCQTGCTVKQITHSYRVSHNV